MQVKYLNEGEYMNYLKKENAYLKKMYLNVCMNHLKKENVYVDYMKKYLNYRKEDKQEEDMLQKEDM